MFVTQDILHLCPLGQLVRASYLTKGVFTPNPRDYPQPNVGSCALLLLKHKCSFPSLSRVFLIHPWDMGLTGQASIYCPSLIALEKVVDVVEFDMEYLQSLNMSFGSGDYQNDSSDPCDAIIVCATQPCDGVLSQGFLRVFMPIFYSAIFLLGLVGNGMVVGVLMRNIRTLAVTETYILHLAVADILLASGMPFWAVEEARGWVFGTVACKLFGALYNINFYSSIYLLGCISFDRYLSIVHAVQMYKKRRPWRVYLSCAVVWCICLLLATCTHQYCIPVLYSDRPVLTRHPEALHKEVHLKCNNVLFFGETARPICGLATAGKSPAGI
ncbi:C-X-C chemokine receptor type 3-like [Heterodontus francisci]|uniref:C-X-C chemokine receptor type 3-like n=1 Tax=Heterodontus francisci TaxID=7792 RepID=UPI00355BB166